MRDPNKHTRDKAGLLNQTPALGAKHNQALTQQVSPDTAAHSKRATRLIRLIGPQMLVALRLIHLIRPQMLVALAPTFHQSFLESRPPATCWKGAKDVVGVHICLIALITLLPLISLRQ